MKHLNPGERLNLLSLVFTVYHCKPRATSDPFKTRFTPIYAKTMLTYEKILVRNVSVLSQYKGSVEGENCKE